MTERPRRATPPTGGAPPWRAAVYYAPPDDHPLWAAGCAWLGRDPSVGAVPVAARPTTLTVEQPARYGFHATLKAPLRLRDGATLGDLTRNLGDVLAELPCFEMPALTVGWMNHYLTLHLADPLAGGHPLQTLAERCVRRLDRWRAPLSAQEWARRESAGLDARGRELVRHWGYPHIFERWRFHMTLSDPLPLASPAQRQALQAAAAAHFGPALAEPLPCDHVCLFEEPHPGAPFRLTQRLPLAAPR